MPGTAEGMKGDARDQRGVGTVLTAGVCLVLLVTAWTVTLMVSWVAQIGSTQDAADLASLAAAGARAEGADACSAAREAALRNRARLEQCEVQGDEWSFVVEVRVSRTLEPSLPGVPDVVERVAVAGSL